MATAPPCPGQATGARRPRPAAARLASPAPCRWPRLGSPLVTPATTLAVPPPARSGFPAARLGPLSRHLPWSPPGSPPPRRVCSGRPSPPGRADSAHRCHGSPPPRLAGARWSSPSLLPALAAQTPHPDREDPLPLLFPTPRRCVPARAHRGRVQPLRSSRLRPPWPSCPAMATAPPCPGQATGARRPRPAAARLASPAPCRWPRLGSPLVTPATTLAVPPPPARSGFPAARLGPLSRHLPWSPPGSPPPRRVCSGRPCPPGRADSAHRCHDSPPPRLAGARWCVPSPVASGMGAHGHARNLARPLRPLAQ
nr:vegetative cell wall protein gp1-like [Aegilops tauschii subsp. strangulata]